MFIKTLCSCCHVLSSVMSGVGQLNGPCRRSQADQQRTHFSVVAFLCQFIGSSSKPAFQGGHGVTIVTEQITAMGYINTQVVGAVAAHICARYRCKMGREDHAHTFKRNSPQYYKTYLIVQGDEQQHIMVFILYSRVYQTKLLVCHLSRFSLKTKITYFCLILN